MALLQRKVNEMAKALRRIRITPDSDLALLIREAVGTGEPVIVDTGEAAYPIYVSAPDTERRPSPEEARRSRDGILEAAGSWEDVDVDAFKADLHERRQASSRPAVRL